MLSKKLIKGKPDNPPIVPVSAPAPVVPFWMNLLSFLDAPAKKRKKIKRNFRGLVRVRKKKKGIGRKEGPQMNLKCMLKS